VLKYEEKLAGEMHTIGRGFLLVVGCWRSFCITALDICISMPVQVGDWGSLLGSPLAGEVGGSPVPSLGPRCGRYPRPKQALPGDMAGSGLD
jgi:hypothetical protein